MVGANKRAWRATAGKAGLETHWIGWGWGVGRPLGDFRHLGHRTVGPEPWRGHRGPAGAARATCGSVGLPQQTQAHSLSLYWLLRLSVWGQVAGLLQGPPSFLAPLLTPPKCRSSPEFCRTHSDLYPATCWAFPVAGVLFTGTCSRLTGSSLFLPPSLAKAMSDPRPCSKPL